MSGMSLFLRTVLRRHVFLAQLLTTCWLGLPTTTSAALLEQVAPVPTSYTFGTGPRFDFYVIEFSAFGDVTALVTAVDLQLGLGNTSTSGCEAADFAGFPAGHIALIQRGSCLFQDKAENAAAVGAVGVLVFNQGDTIDDSRQDAIFPTLSAGYTGGIPVLFLSYDLGADLANTTGLVMHMRVEESDFPVPAPATLLLLGSGFAGLGTLAWRRRR